MDSERARSLREALPTRRDNSDGIALEFRAK